VLGILHQLPMPAQQAILASFRDHDPAAHTAPLLPLRHPGVNRDPATTRQLPTEGSSW
jgi:hypothetical protein